MTNSPILCCGIHRHRSIDHPTRGHEVHEAIVMRRTTESTSASPHMRKETAR